MKNHSQKNKFHWTKTLSVFFFVLLLGAYAYTFAVPPDTKYSAGETLDPNCGPLDPNCSVDIGSVSMVYPSSGIAVSTGTAWGTSITGTSSQFVKANGSLDSNTYVTGTPWTSMGYITDGNTGWDNSYGFITSYTETDPIVGAINGLVKANGSGTISAVVSGTDIKTINGSSILGSGDITISGGGSMVYPGSGIAVSTGSAWGTSITGTSSQFVKADGSLDSNTYLTSLSGALLANGTVTGATSQAQTFTNGVNLSNLTQGYLPYASNTSKLLANSPIYTDGTNVGIGTSSPLAKLHIGNGTSINSTNPTVLISQNIDNTGSGSSHGISDSSYITRTGSVSYASFDSNAQFAGSADYGHYVSFQANPTYGSSGTIGNLYSFTTTPTVNTGTATNVIGLLVNNPEGNGTVGTMYGIYLNNLSKAGTNYAIWSSGTAKSVLYGPLGLGVDPGLSALSLKFNNGFGNTQLVMTNPINNNDWSLSVAQDSLKFVEVGVDTRVTFVNGGNVGIGTTSPTAVLQLKAGTATAGTAPLKFTNGTNLTTPENGAIEYDGSHLYFTAGGTRYQLDQQSGGSSPVTVVNTSNLFSTGLSGTGSGVTATDDSIFLGVNAGSSATTASYSNFIGYQAGYNATDSYDSNFIGKDAGSGANSAEDANFIGVGAGQNATGAYSSTFIGYAAGHYATGAYESNFIGNSAGDYSSGAYSSNFIGSNAGYNAENAYKSLFLGLSAGNGATNASNSIFIGQQAGKDDTVDNRSDDDDWSILIGYNTNTGGYKNSILLGGSSSTTAISNTKANQFMLADSITDVRWGGVEYTLPSAQGSSGQVLTNDGSGVLSWTAPSAILLSDADYNTVGGTDAGLNLVSGAQYNTFLGYQAGMFSASSTNVADNNTAIGYQSLYSNTTGNVNSALGSGSLYSNTTGTGNSAFGISSLYYNTEGQNNSAFGGNSLANNTTGYGNSAFGSLSLSSNATGGQNSTLGLQSLQNNTAGSDNSALGSSSLYSNTTGSSNSVLGSLSLYSSKTGSNGVAIGYGSQLYANDTTTPWINMNTSIGYQSLMGSTTAADNTGNSNTAIGYASILSNTVGQNNSALGYSSLTNNTTGSYNIGIGSQAGMVVNASASPNQTSSNSIYIGYNTQGLLDGDTNEIVIGHEAVGHGSNTAQWGNTSITNHYLSGNVQFSSYSTGTLMTDASGNITASSDERLKDIQGNFDNNGNALDIINSINPILYKWNDISGFDQTTTYAGFSAQNIRDVIPEAVDTDSRGYLTLSDRPILATTVNAIKELDLKVKEFYSLDTSSATSLGAMIKDFVENEVNQFEKIFAKTVVTEGIEMKDTVTGEDYCVVITNGEFEKIKGKCGEPIEENIVDNNNLGNGDVSDAVESDEVKDETEIDETLGSDEATTEGAAEITPEEGTGEGDSSTILTEEEEETTAEGILESNNPTTTPIGV